MTSECESMGAVTTDEVLWVPCKQSENSAEENSDEVYESSLGTMSLLAWGQQDLRCLGHGPCSRGTGLKLIQPIMAPCHRAQRQSLGRSGKNQL